MTVSQTRTGEGPRAQNLPGRLAAIRAPHITPQDVAAARTLLQRTGNQDLAEVLGLEEGSGK